VNIHFLNYIIAHVLVGIVPVCIGLMVWVRNRRSYLYTTFLLYNFVISWWGLFTVLMQLAPSPAVALFFDRIELLAIVFIPSTSLHFTLEYLRKARQFKPAIVLAYCLSVLFFILVFTPYMLTGVSTKGFIKYFTDPGPAYLGFVIIFSFLMTAVAFAVYISYRKESEPIRKQGLLYFLIATVLGVVGGSGNFLVPYGILIPGLIPYGTYAVVIYGVITAYVIVHYRLLDIRVAVTRAGIFAIIYLLVLGVPFWVMARTGNGWISTIFAVLLASGGPLVYTYIRGRAEAILLKEQRKYHKVLADFGAVLSIIKDDNKRLFGIVVLKMSEVVDPQFLAIYKYEPRQKAYIRESVLSTEETVFGEKISEASSLVQALKEKQRAVLGDSAGKEDIPPELMVLPFFVAGELYGFLIMGPRKNKIGYSLDDVNVFQSLAIQISLALENCLFFEHRRQLEQITRQKSIDNLTLSMGHEILNPVFAASLPLDTLERLLKTDFKDRVPEDIREYCINVLNSSFASLMRVKKLIDSVKEFSGQTSGEFTEISMDAVLESFCVLFNVLVKHDSAFFEKVVEPGIKLKGNKIHLEEVFMNIGVNSLQAVQRNEAGKKNLLLRMYRKDNEKFIIKFTDNGCGIDSAMLQDIFLDFVTTKASSLGTGMGLARVRKIVEQHGGKIWAESKGLGQGATFVIELPLLGEKK